MINIQKNYFNLIQLNNLIFLNQQFDSLIQI